MGSNFHILLYNSKLFQFTNTLSCKANAVQYKQLEYDIVTLKEKDVLAKAVLGACKVPTWELGFYAFDSHMSGQ